MRVLILTTLCLLCFYSQGSEDEKVSAVIDSLHQYAAQAKFNEYFERVRVRRDSIRPP